MTAQVARTPRRTLGGRKRWPGVQGGAVEMSPRPRTTVPCGPAGGMGEAGWTGEAEPDGETGRRPRPGSAGRRLVAARAWGPQCRLHVTPASSA